MAYLKINGTAVPYPKRGVSTIVSTLVNSGRNIEGKVVGERIGRDQYKIDNLEWPWLTAAQWSQILQLVSGFKFTLTFWDPVTNAEKSIPAYCGDRSAEPYWVNSQGKPTHYRNCKVNLIDIGGDV